MRKFHMLKKEIIILMFSGVATSIVTPVLAAGTVYNEENDTYYELVNLPPPGHQNEVSWRKAASLASEKTFKKRKGRLAIIDTLDEHKFVTKHVDFRKPTWIGLRYWCAARVLTWIDGREHGAQSFQPWAVPWHRTRVRCGSVPYMPVYYNEQNRWQASGGSKRFMAFLVEYKPISNN